MTYCIWLGIARGWYILLILEVALGMKTVTLEVIQPSTGPVCLGQEVILTCIVARTDAATVTFLNWRLGSTALTVQYDSSNPSSGPDTLGDFITTAVFMTSTTSTVIVSNATLTSAALSNNNSTLSCISPPGDIQTTNIIVAGTKGMPFGLQIIPPASLTWLPPPNTNCTFNYTVNITNSSCSMTVYSSSTSLIPTDLLTRGQNYSFSVAVTDSTGQHGPWSDQLRIVWEIPGVVSNISYQLLNKTAIIADWEPPPSPTHPPVLYYTVTHNVSCDGSELAFNTTTNKAILNGTSYEETYYISVCAINAIGKGKITTITANISESVEPSNRTQDTGSTTIYIIASSLGATVLFILLLVIVPILALVCSKGKHHLQQNSRVKQKELVFGNELYTSVSLQNNVQTAIETTSVAKASVCDISSNQPCCLQGQRSPPKDLVYAQVGTRLPNAPIAPPSIDKVVYATVH